MFKVTPLHEIEAGAGARFETFGGWEVAAHYGDPRAEYESLRRGVAVLDACFQGKLRASGKDRVRYLNNMLTYDIRNLAAGMGCHAALLTRQGHVESDLWVYAFGGEHWLECPPGATGQVLATLDKHIVSDKVILQEFTEEYAILSLQGPDSRAAMERAVGIPLAHLKPMDHLMLEPSGSKWIVVCRDRTGCGGYDLWLPRAEAADRWRRWVENGIARPAGLGAWNWIRTEAGIPWFGIDMDERSLPMEMGLDDAISMNKGCYRGQEIVARITQRGHLDRGLGGIAIDAPEPPARGAEVRAGGARIGAVSSAILSPCLGKPLALAVLKRPFLQPSTSVEVDCGGFRAGEVVTLPLSIE